jgi:hypothetical protein
MVVEDDAERVEVCVSLDEAVQSIQSMLKEEEEVVDGNSCKSSSSSSGVCVRVLVTGSFHLVGNLMVSLNVPVQ